jgi:hypothetical protein
MCAKCRIRQAVVTGSLCALCAAGVTAADSAAHQAGHHARVTITRTVAARPSGVDRPEQPHPPEIEANELPGTETENPERHVIVLDHPKYGLLNGLNYIGYCEGCPAERRGDLCYGPCAGETNYLGCPPALTAGRAPGGGSQPSAASATSRDTLGEAV